MKRLFDLTLTLLGSIIAVPLGFAVAFAVRMRLGSPVLFPQTRAGRDGKPFTLYKFRTMRPPGPDESEHPRHDDARTTSLGRLLRATSLDELPSLYNVVRGEMSLVGPRPLPMRYLERYTTEQARRLEVLPGVTGWAVVHGRNLLTWEERFALDCWYVDHHSVTLDTKILLSSITMVMRRTGVNHADGVTMHEFEGA